MLFVVSQAEGSPLTTSPLSPPYSLKWREASAPDLVTSLSGFCEICDLVLVLNSFPNKQGPDSLGAFLSLGRA